MNYQREAEKMVVDWRSLGTMWGEARAQRMESWLECDPEDLDWDDILSDTHGDTLYWLEQVMNDCDEEELSEGGLYHWMVVAYEEAGG